MRLGSLQAYKANFNIFNAKVANFGGLCCLSEWTNVDKKRTKIAAKIAPKNYLVSMVLSLLAVCCFFSLQKFSDPFIFCNLIQTFY